MDSVTQITLGAAVGEAVLGRQLGNRAIFWGAVFGTMPDLDIVLTPFVDSVGFVVHHRGLSHSLAVLGVASPLLAWAFVRWYRRQLDPPGYGRWLAFFVLVFLTHVLLDCCTTYGTQLWLPFSDRRVAWNNIFVIDPLYTVPFALCVVACLFLARESRWRRRINYAGLLLSTGYLALTFVNKAQVDDVFGAALARQEIAAKRCMSCPTPLNNVLWYAVAEVDDGYYVGFYSLLDSTNDVRLQFVPRSEALLGDLAGTYAVDRLVWFADGYYCVRPHSDGILLHVMKFGRLDFEGQGERYPFTYLVRHTANPGAVVQRLDPPRDESLGQLAAQLWSRLLGR